MSQARRQARRRCPRRRPGTATAARRRRTQRRRRRRPRPARRPRVSALSMSHMRTVVQHDGPDHLELRLNQVRGGGRPRRPPPAEWHRRRLNGRQQHVSARRLPRGRAVPVARHHERLVRSPAPFRRHSVATPSHTKPQHTKPPRGLFAGESSPPRTSRWRECCCPCSTCGLSPNTAALITSTCGFIINQVGGR